MANAPDSSELSPLIEAGFDLIPLHRYDKTTVRKNKDGSTRTEQRGKTPVHANWRNRKYGDVEQAVTHMRRGWNVGVRLRDDQIVIDVDPRHFKKGDDPLERLALDFDLDLDQAPTVITGSGGKHIYFTKPKGVKVLNSLEGYEGVEFKSAGRQVVAPGSLHPDTGEMYRWDDDRPHAAEAPKMPKGLGKEIARREVDNKSEGGEYTVDQIVAMLDSMDPSEFDSNDPWFKLMSAVHQATGGEARDEFIAWSTGDGQYADDGAIIGLRWDSLSADKEGAKVGKGTLDQLVIKHGDRNTIPKHTAAEEFGDGEHAMDTELDDETVAHLEEVSKEERMIDRLLRDCWLVRERQPVIAVRQYGKGSEAHELVWATHTQEAFKAEWANAPVLYRLVDGKRKPVSMFEAWMTSTKRKTAVGFEFDPTGEPIIKAKDGTLRLNEWRGWSYPPVGKEQGWALLDQMIWEVFCDGREDLYKYILNWCAYLFQHPEKPAEVAFCMRGGKGIGKGTLGNILNRLTGQYGMKIEDPDALTNNFNQHLHKRVFLFADEAVKPYDQKAESKLKSILTEPTMRIEPKGKDSFQAQNYLHIMMASNSEWIVPMDMLHERRYFVVDGKPVYQNKIGFWDALHDQLENGGYEAFLHDMLSRDIEGWHPRWNIPHTQAMDDQRQANLDPIPAWWLAVVHSGFDDPMTVMALAGEDEEVDWDKQEVTIPNKVLYDEFARFCKELRINAGSNGRIYEGVFGKELRKVCETRGVRVRFLGEAIGFNKDGQNRVKATTIPSRQDCIQKLKDMGLWRHEEITDEEDDDLWD